MGGKFPPLLLEAPIRVSPRVLAGWAYGAVCPWPNVARALPHRTMPLPAGGAMLAPFQKVLEASGTIPINPKQFRTPKTALPYMNLILRTIPEPLVMSRIQSETPNENS